MKQEIATFFMDIVNSSHAYATGGTSASEFWSDPKRLAEALTTETEESCTTYNMLKPAGFTPPIQMDEGDRVR